MDNSWIDGFEKLIQICVFPIGRGVNSSLVTLASMSIRF